MVNYNGSAGGKDNHDVRQVFNVAVSRGNARAAGWFNALCLKTTSGDIAADPVRRAPGVGYLASLGQSGRRP